MTGILKVDQWKDSGDNTLMTSDGAGNLTVNAPFSSTGIDDNATSTAITIDSSENVGIGTGSPDGSSFSGSSSPVLDVSGTRPLIILSETDANTKKAWLGLSSDVFYVGGTNTTTVFYTDNAERLRIDSSGNVLLGKTSSGAGNRGIEFTNLSSANPRQTITSTGTGAETKIEFRNGNGYAGEIYTNGSGTTYLTSSDYRLKENVVDLDDATTRVKQLQPKRFNFIADADTTVDGFLAHEVSSIVPEAIKGTHNKVQVWEEGEELPEGVSVGDNKIDDEGNTIPVYQGIDQSKLVPLLTASLKEAIAKIEELETRIATLENA